MGITPNRGDKFILYSDNKCSNYISSLPIVFIVIVIGSEVNFVHGTWINSSLMLPDLKLNGNCNSCSKACRFNSRFWKVASPPQKENLKIIEYYWIIINNEIK